MSWMMGREFDENSTRRNRHTGSKYHRYMFKFKKLA